MANENKLIGVLQLDNKGVLDAIARVNEALKTLGQGIDLDLTKIINTRVSAQLAQLKTQIDEVSKAATKQSASHASQTKEAARAIREITDLETKMIKANEQEGPVFAMRKARYDELKKQLDSYSGEVIRSAMKEKNVLDALERNMAARQKNANDTNRAYAKQQEAQIKQEAKVTQDALQARVKAEEAAAKAAATASAQAAAEEKKVQEAQAKYNVQQLNEQRQARQEYIDWWAQALAKKEETEAKAEQEAADAVAKRQREQAEYNIAQWNAQLKARQEYEKEYAKLMDEQEKSQIKAATENLKQQVELQRQFINTTNPQKQDEILAQLDEKKRAFHEYSEEIRNAAYADASVLDAQNKLAIESARLVGEAEQKSYDEVRDARVRILNLERDLKNINLGKAQRSELTDQLNQEKAAYAAYSQEMRNKVETDSRVIKAANEVAVAGAKAADDALREQKEKMEKSTRYAEQIMNRLTMVLGRFSLQLLRNQWNAAVDYAKTYYDTLNEIRVITGKTEQEVSKLGDTYRQMAQSMSVTSTELASAAATFYRQGLNDSQVQSRLEWVTKYAKVAGTSFETAAELITASANAMSADIQGDIQRVVDVFLYLGDNAATTGEEIGTAMQKASASATEFGVSFEWLGTYIATVAEQTRQAPETIGNAFNSMMARMHSIRETGFNSEDETTINQVAKALKQVDIELMDSTGNWRNMEDIFAKVAEQWDNLTGKEKSYIATTVAGVRQQNVFYALMNDMSKGIQGGSRAWELYTGALNAAGTATQKYETWQESLEATQANLTNSLETLYASLSSDVIKNFINFLAGAVDGLNTLGGVVPVVVAVIIAGGIAVAAVIKQLIVKTIELKSAMAATSAVFMTHPLFVGATLVVVLLGIAAGIGAMINRLNGVNKETQDYNKTLDETTNKINSLQKTKKTLTDSFDKMQSGTKLTNQELSEYNAALQNVSSISGSAALAVNDLTKDVSSQKDAFNGVIDAIDNVIAEYETYNRVAARNALYTAVLPEGTTQSSSPLNDLHTIAKAAYEQGLTQGIPTDAFNPFEYSNAVFAYSSMVNSNVDLSEAFRKAYQEAWKEFQASPNYDTYWNKMSDGLGGPGEGFGIFYDLLMGKLFGGENSTAAIKSKIESTAEQYVALAIQAVGDVGSDVYKRVLHDAWKDMIIDDAGYIVEDAARVLLAAIDNVDAYLSDDAIVQTIAKNLFGADSATALLQDVDIGLMADAIGRAYEEAIEAGLSNADIASMLKNFWSRGQGSGTLADLADYLSDLLWIAFSDAVHSEEILGNEYFKENGGSNEWGADVTSQVLMLQLIQLGHTKEEIDKIFADSESLEEFNQALEGLVSRSRETGTAFEDLMKTVTNNLSYIDKIDAILKTINEDQTFDADKLLEIAKTNPEILASAGSIDTLREALEKLRRTQLDELRTQYTQLLSSVEGIDPENIEAVVDALINWQTIKPTESISSDMKKLQTNLDTLDEIIKSIDEGEPVTSKDIFDVAEIDQGLLAYTSSLKGFRAALVTERENILKEQQTLYEQLVLQTPAYMDFGTMGWIKRMYGVNTLQEAMDLFSSEEFVTENGQDKAEQYMKAVESFVQHIAQTLMGWSKSMASSPFQKFLADVKKLDEAKGSLDTILHPDGKDASNIINAWNTLFEMFPRLKQDGTASVEDVKAEVEALEGSVRETAVGFGDLGQGIIDSMLGGTQAVRLLSEEMQNSFFATATKENIGAYMEKYFNVGNVDWTNRKRVSADKMIEAGYSDFEGSAYETKYGTDYTKVVGNQNYKILLTPILPDGRVLSPDALDAYADEIAVKAEQMGITLLEADAVENGGKGLLYYMAEVGDSIEEADEKAMEFESSLSRAQAAYYFAGVAEYANKIAEDVATAKQQLEGYQTILSGMSAAYVNSGMIDDAIVFFASLSDETQAGFTSEYEELTVALGEAAAALGELKDAEYRLANAQETMSQTEEGSEEWLWAAQQAEAAAEESDKAAEKLQQAEEKFKSAMQAADMKVLVKQSENLAKAKEYLDALDPSKEGYSITKAFEAFEQLKKLFPELSSYTAPTEEFLKEANNLVDNVDESVSDTLTSIGLVTDKMAELVSATKAYKNELEVKQASQTGYSEQVAQLSAAVAAEDKALTQQIWKSYTDEMRKALENAYPEMVNAMREWIIQDTPEETVKLRGEIAANKGALKEAESKYAAAEQQLEVAQANYADAEQQYKNAQEASNIAMQKYAPVQEAKQQYAQSYDALQQKQNLLTPMYNQYGVSSTEELLSLFNDPEYRSQYKYSDATWEARIAFIQEYQAELAQLQQEEQSAWEAYQEALSSSDVTASDLQELNANTQITSDALNDAAVSIRDAETNLKTASETMENASSALEKSEENLESAADPEMQAMQNLAKSLKDIQKINATKYFKSTATATKDLKAGIVSISDAYADFYSEAEKAVTAQSEYLTATDKMANGADVALKDVSTLAEFLGFDAPQAVLANWDQVGPMLAAAIDEGTDALQRLNEAAFINITGSSTADFSNVMKGLVAVQDEADETIQKLLATGQWTLTDPQEVDQEMPLWLMGEGGKITFKELHATAKYRFLKPTGNNPFKGAKSTYTGSGTSSGGGGGGGSSSKGMTEVQRMLDRMAQVQDIQGHTRSLYSAQASLYEQTGQLQGVIKYYEKERTAIEQQNKTLQANIDEMEPWLKKKKAEVAALDVASAEYEEASKDLKDLQNRHQEYTLALINNTAEIDKLTESIKKQRDSIRQMEIDLRNTILNAIKDREALNERILQGTIDMENTILDLIKKRYEKERDMIVENTQKQIDALQQERDLLSEQLELRKQQAEEEDKAAKLAELETKYARISADPTRQKEALSTQKEIKDLRDEMAWDLAEKEVKAQQDSIDQQIDSLEDYVTYIENYYEYLFEHPQKLIAEMKEIIKGTDEEIIAWLIANDEEYAEATEATKQQTVDSWRDMLLDMRGELELFWDEVEEIITQGDEYIINFLKENTAAYKEAGKQQAEAYVDEWLEQLDDLRKAYELVTGEIAPYDYTYVAPAEGSSSGGGGGGGDGDGQKKTKTFLSTLKEKVKESLEPIKSEHLGGRSGSVKQEVSVPKSLWNNTSTVQTPKMPDLGDTVNTTSSTVSVGDIIVNVETLDKDSDYEELAQKVLDTVTEKMNRGSVVGGIRYTV